ncbi:type II toxin-antitoxin system RelE family toxin [Candidatus Bandiella numerosa]|uniref:type II toxin-antitoxin system RelE family toxin n=1 Tax=Candidatus Bandiella numerosa TaxID=2570586 RepID=UPI001F22D926|nr:type II toxin-antitoxin system RelE/ParE family toxin [Candidatus Bandiella numerosa]
MWFIRLNKIAAKELEKLDRSIQVRVISFLETRVAFCADPRSLGKSLKGKIFGKLVRFRVGDYRLICDIKDKEITVLVLRIAHRSGVYDG